MIADIAKHTIKDQKETNQVEQQDNAQLRTLTQQHLPAGGVECPCHHVYFSAVPLA